MHILVISSFLPPYGGYFCVEQAKALANLGHEVRIILAQQLGLTIYPKMFFTAPSRRWWESDGNVEIYRTNFRGIPKVVKPNLQRYCKFIDEMFDDYICKYGKPDVLHAHAAKWAGVAAMNISKRTGIPYFITEHLSRGAYERDFGVGWNKHIWAKHLLRQAFESACCVIPVARELVETTKDFFGDSYKWKEISNVVDVEFFAFRERALLGKRPFRFCCLAISNGKWFYNKGYDVLIEAFDGIENAELHIAGRATDGFAMSEAVKGKKKIILHGDLTKQQVRDLLYECDALVLASKSEVQPLVVLEALSTGIPFVGTEVIPESERINGACIICPVGDVGMLRQAMINVMSISPSSVFSEKVKALASPKVVAEQLEKIFLWKS